MTCIFCDPADEIIVLSNKLAYARFDNYPVSPGHLLIVPYRHFADYFDRNAAETASLWALVDEAKRHLDRQHSPDGYNVGVNAGTAVGQSVMHLHIHLIPRYAGDMDAPKGGVRGVIPSKQSY